MKQQQIPLADLQPDARNANLGTERGRKALAHSLKEYGAGRSILIDRHNRIIGGNKTAQEAAAAGLENVLLVETDGSQLVAVKRTDLDLDDPKARALAFADNRVAELDLAWDAEQLSREIAAGLDLSAFWEETEIEALVGQMTEAAGGLLPDADPDALPEAVETRVQPGELWELGRHRVGCLSSTDPETLTCLFGAETPGMVFADPPYGVKVVRAGKNGGDKPFGKNGGGGAVGNRPGRTVEARSYAPIIGDDTTETACSAYRLTASHWPGAVQIWWGANYYADALPVSACWLVWDKETTGDFADAELAWTNRASPVRLFRHLWNGLCRGSEKGQPRVHPTQKPVALAEWVFATYGAGVDLIFDPFLGSGSSLIAAEKCGKRVVGCELSPEYCDVVIARFEKATGQTARRLQPAA